MPIYDQNDSLRAVNWGMNQVWRDVGRHRHEPTFLCGPHTTASPYMAPYLQLSGAELKRLVMSEQKLLPLPQDSYEDLDIVVPDNVNLASIKINHVLPLPLIDRVLATSRLNVPGAWYSSPLRHEWANHELDDADAMVEEGELNDAALTMASVFGTMLRGYLAGDKDEAVLCMQAWSRLSVFVDANFFLYELAKSFHRDTVHEANLPAFKRSMRDIVHIGPVELAAAEEVRRLEKRVVEMERFMEETGLPMGARLGEIPILKLAMRGMYKVRMIGIVHVFKKEQSIFAKNRKKRDLTRWAIWAFDRRDGNKLKLLQVPSALVDEIARFEDEHPDQGGPDGSNWSISVRYYHKPHRRVRFYVKKSEPVPFTEDELKTYEKDASREKVVGFYNGRMDSLEQYEVVKKMHQDAVDAYCNQFGGEDAEAVDTKYQGMGEKGV